MRRVLTGMPGSSTSGTTARTRYSMLAKLYLFDKNWKGNQISGTVPSGYGDRSDSGSISPSSFKTLPRSISSSSRRPCSISVSLGTVVGTAFSDFCSIEAIRDDRERCQAIQKEENKNQLCWTLNRQGNTGWRAEESASSASRCNILTSHRDACFILPGARYLRKHARGRDR